MTIYYERLEDDTIGNSTPFEDVAKENNLTLMTEEEIVFYNGKRYLQNEFDLIAQSDEYIQEEALKERERINLLNMTKADFWICLLEKNITKQDVLKKIELILEEKQKAKAKIQFEDASNYWRGNEFMDVIGQMFGISPEELDYLFEHKQFPNNESEE